LKTKKKNSKQKNRKVKIRLLSNSSDGKGTAIGYGGWGIILSSRLEKSAWWQLKQAICPHAS
jgi:hypothetical protein